jgi:hypothetical protein
MPRRDIEAIRDRSRAGQKGPWVTDYPAMCLKTALRQWCKYIPMSPEVTRAVSLDELHEVGIDQRLADYAKPMIPADLREETDLEFPNGDALDELADAMEVARDEAGIEEREDPIDITPPEDGGDEGSPAVESGDGAPPDVDPQSVEYQELLAAAFELWGDDAHKKFGSLRRTLKIPEDKEFFEMTKAQKEKYLQAMKTAIAVAS